MSILQIETVSNFQDDMMNKISSFTGTTAALNLCSTEHTRVALLSGQRTCRTIELPPGLPDSVALELACGRAGVNNEPVSVCSAGPLFHLPGVVATALSRSGIPPSRLELALTGTTLRHAAVECLLALSALRDLGIELALHGFGGPGSLLMIEHLPISAVILRPALIRDLPGNAVAAAVLQRLLDLAHDQRLRVVATGIDSEPQRALLSGLGCQEGEGALFGSAGPHRAEAAAIMHEH